MLTAQDNATLVRARYDAFNQRDLDKVLAMVREDVKWTNLPFDMIHNGRDGQRQYIENWTTALSDAKVEILNLVAGDEWTAAECIVRGTHTGPLVAPNGTISPTYTKIELSFCELHRVVDGEIVEGRLYFDGATLMRQLGMPSTKSPSAVPAGH
jgi:ketosteroid isomerase-like protein